MSNPAIPLSNVCAILMGRARRRHAERRRQRFGQAQGDDGLIIASVVDGRRDGEGRADCRPGIPDRVERGGWIARDRYPAGRRGLAVRAVRGRGGKALRRYSGMNAAMGQIYAGYRGDDLELGGEEPRPPRLDAGFTERPGRLYRPAIREQFAAIVK